MQGTAPVRLVVAVAGALAAPAQQPAGAFPLDLGPVKQAFAEATRDGVTAVAAVMVGTGEPLLLTAGTDAGGEALGPRTLLPLGSAVRLLAGDAMRGRAEDAAGLDAVAFRFDGGQLSARELLLGSAVLPDWYSFDPGAAAPDVRVLADCAALATRLDRSFQVSCGGVAELPLLRAQVDPDADWATFLRVRLAPQGIGVDPVDLAALDAGASRRLAVRPGLVDGIRSATPDCLRLGLTTGDLRLWLRARLDAGTPPTGKRSGRTSRVDGHDDRTVWSWVADNGVPWFFAQYPDAAAGLAVFGPRSVAIAVRRTLEGCLFGPSAPAGRFGGMGGGRRATLRAIAGAWVPVVGAHGGGDLRIDVGLFLGEVLVLHWRGQQLRSEVCSPAGADGYEVRLDSELELSERVSQLLLWRHGEGDEERLRAAFVEQTATGCVPRCVDFARR